MKKATKILMLLTVTILLAVTESKAQKQKTPTSKWLYYMPSIPPVPATKKPPQPSPRSTWVAAEWNPYDRKYDAAHWQTTLRADMVWTPGHWVKHPKGYEWVGGHWK